MVKYRYIIWEQIGKSVGKSRGNLSQYSEQKTGKFPTNNTPAEETQVLTNKSLGEEEISTSKYIQEN